MSDKEPELLPCPFCGGKARFGVDENGWQAYAICAACCVQMESPVRAYREGWKEAVAADWNQRVDGADK
ncbi:MAG: Lar family restriction alleviation protein [Paraprevotella sp.]|nr:Lar family restriction alleviation protein [Paraprevotella sp.]